MMTAQELFDAMTEHEREHAPGSETTQGQWFTAWLYDRGYLRSGQDQIDTLAVQVDSYEAAYWMAVASGDLIEASKFGEIPEEWQGERGVK